MEPVFFSPLVTATGEKKKRERGTYMIGSIITIKIESTKGRPDCVDDGDPELSAVGQLANTRNDQCCPALATPIERASTE